MTLTLPQGAMSAGRARHFAKLIEQECAEWRTYTVANRPREWWIHVYFGPTSDGPSTFIRTIDSAERLLDAARARVAADREDSIA